VKVNFGKEMLCLMYLLCSFIYFVLEVCFNPIYLFVMLPSYPSIIEFFSYLVIFYSNRINSLSFIFIFPFILSTRSEVLPVYRKSPQPIFTPPRHHKILSVILIDKKEKQMDMAIGVGL
jgi:hypothetical protein